MKAPDGTFAAENMRRWCGDTPLKDSDGLPVVFYHGTTSDFSQFELNGLGIHVGTMKAANDRLHLLGAHFDGAIMPVVARCQRLLELPDIGWEFPASVMDELFNHGVVDGDAADRLFLQVDRLTAEDEWHPEAFALVREAILAAGYDGIVYQNDCEDPGSLSYIVLRPSDLKSALGNSGAFSLDDPDITDRRALEDVLRAKSAAIYVSSLARAVVAPAI
jgi:hypothetical protein